MGTSSINGSFSMAMLNNQRVYAPNAGFMIGYAGATQKRMISGLMMRCLMLAHAKITANHPQDLCWAASIT